MIQRFSLALIAAALVAGCSSGVKLDQAPVEERNASAATATTNTGNGSATSQSAVAGVDLSANASKNAGPAGVERIVYFDYDSYTVKPQFQAQLDAHARFLKANSARKVSLEGHTDERGGREYNLALGQKRAEAVRRALTLLGVSDSQLEAVSFGKEKPAAVGSDEASLAQNRRVEISYR
ncbi:peptidoglycan-associated lipoprotein Pal [Curvibacter sp. HBC61]|uniref:Peptidoglycan-associated lipoprotein n=1 Tax=Curvibacter cyanobacteriorum TaxID=3026422 RepID=A0ABT5MUA2_9BURK|nr:peptidoglycan-associated lipoprotein Pal [Curvibacter sp. HBC61]MDD0837422.1 peptidoglycan-associated lipoprotein Pal [Curvibacter sp. HBC61]